MKLENVNDFESIRGKIAARLVNRERNPEMLREMPGREFLDLAVVYHLLLVSDGSGQAVMQIRNEHMKIWNVTEEELYACACANMRDLCPAVLESMDEFMECLLGTGEDGKALYSGDESVSPLYILTNRSGVYGASVVLDPDTLRRAADRLGGDLLILPSSIHEVLLLRLGDCENLQWLRRVVYMINRKELREEDILSDSVYCYRCADGKMDFAEE